MKKKNFEDKHFYENSHVTTPSYGGILSSCLVYGERFFLEQAIYTLSYIQILHFDTT